MDDSGHSGEDDFPGAKTRGGASGTPWRAMLLPDAKFNEKKFQDHRRFTGIVLGLMAVFLALLWGWDHVTDPAGARSTIGLRLTYLLILPLAYGCWSGKVRWRFLSAVIPLTLLLSEVVFVEILNRLDTGMIHGIGGFMYAMFIAMLIGQGMTLIRGVSYALAAAMLPQFMALLGLADGFQQLRYATLIWPAAGLTVLAQVAQASDYLRRHRLEEQLKALSDTDPLSGIANRRCFMRSFEQEIARARRLGLRLALLTFDIDHFKRINDLHGHPTGDLVIRQVAEICARGLRSIDALGRIGDEEFAAFLTGDSIDDAATVAERLRALVESAETQSTAGTTVRFTVSIGVTELRPRDTCGIDLFMRADAALYAAKAGGRNRVDKG